MSPEVLHLFAVGLHVGMAVALVIGVVLVSTWGGAHLVAKTFELTLAVVRMMLLDK